MHVHIHPLGVADQVQHGGRVTIARQKIEIGHPQRPQKRAVQHRAAINADKLLHRRPARIGRQGRIAGQAQAITLDVDLQRVVDKITAQNAGQTPVQRLEEIARQRIGAKDKPRSLAVRDLGQAKADLRFRHRQPLDHIGNRLGFGAVGAQEFQPRRRGIKQIAQLDRRAAHRRRGPQWRHPPTRNRQAGALVPLGARGQRQPPHGTQTGQSLAAKTERADVQQIRAVDLRSRMPRHGQGQIFGRHAAAIVRDADQHLAAGRILDRDAPRPRIQRIFDQFLDRRGRPFNHLTRRNAVDRRFVQRANNGAYIGGMNCHTPNPSSFTGAGP